MQLSENSVFESKLLPLGSFSTVLHLVSMKNVMGNTAKDWDKNTGFLYDWIFLISYLMDEETEALGSEMICHGVCSECWLIAE